MKKLTSTFTAYTDNGHAVKINVFTSFHDATTLTTPNGMIAGLKRLETDDGKHVRRLEQGRYRVETGQELVSDEPGAE